MATDFFRISKNQSFFDFWAEQAAPRSLEFANPLSLDLMLNIGAIYVNQNRISEPIKLAEGDICRLHFNPKRYAKFNFSSQRLICGETKDLIVVHKPAGVPVHATLDNVSENLLQWMISDLGIPLHNTHRLDVGTQGLLIFAKTKMAASRIHRALFNQTLKKKYVAFLDPESQIPAGELIHWMHKSARQPKKLSSTEIPDSLLCKLEILESFPTAPYHRLKIKLVTGRTHQIRCQLAHIGSPIIGDRLYGSNENYFSHSWTTVKEDSWALACVELEFENQIWKSIQSEEFQIY